MQFTAKTWYSASSLGISRSEIKVSDSSIYSVKCLQLLQVDGLEVWRFADLEGLMRGLMEDLIFVFNFIYLGYKNFGFVLIILVRNNGLKIEDFLLLMIEFEVRWRFYGLGIDGLDLGDAF